MGKCKGCMYCCAPYTLISAILLFVLYAMIETKSWTFEVLIAQHEWDADLKARCCRNAGIFYLAVSAVLWILVIVDSYVMDLGQIAARLGGRSRKPESMAFSHLPQTASTTPVITDTSNTFAPAGDRSVSPLVQLGAGKQSPPSRQLEQRQQYRDPSGAVGPEGVTVNVRSDGGSVNSPRDRSETRSHQMSEASH